MRAFITGGTGQDGFYLVQALRGMHPNVSIYALYRGQDEARLERFRLEMPDVRWLRGDITDAASVMDAVLQAKPDLIFNLAAASFVGLSWNAPGLYMEVNLGGTLNVLEAARKAAPGAHIVQASTSEMFGNAPNGQGVNETSRMEPASPYGVSKLAAHHLCRVYRESFGLHVSSAIAFNHESPRRPPIFVTRKVTQAVARIAAGSGEVLSLGNLDACRDWGYAGDYMRAYVLMAQAHKADDYIIGTGVAHSVADLVRRAFGLVGIEDWQAHVVSSERPRPVDVSYLCADPAKIEARLGWRAETTFEELVEMMVQHDLREVKSGALLGAK